MIVSGHQMIFAFLYYNCIKFCKFQQFRDINIYNEIEQFINGGHL